MEKYELYSFAPRNSNILYWWKTNEMMFPLLAKIARTILAIPSSSAKSERVLSTGYIYIFPISCTTVTINYYCCTGCYTRGSSDSPGVKWAIMDGEKLFCAHHGWKEFRFLC
jgi:hypothetical protein